MICVSWQIFLLFNWVPHDHRHYHHRFLFLISAPTACHISKFTSVLSAFLQRWWNGFHQLTTCLDHNVASLWQRHLVYFLCPHSLSFFSPLIHTNPYLVSTPPSSLALLFCFLWFPLVLSVHLSFFIVLVWWLYAWWMFDTRSDGCWHRDFASCPCSLRHFISSTPRLKSLCW